MQPYTMTHIVLLAVLMWSNPIAPSHVHATEGNPYSTAARAYADAMIASGRDTYGSITSPLFASALSRSVTAIGTFDRIPGVRDHDRATTGSNPYHHTALYALLYHLSTTTQQPTYAIEADRALTYFLLHAQNDTTGLLAWGEHAFWDFQTDAAGGRRIHEIQGPWPFWDVFYRADPDASRRFVLGLWRHQVADHGTGNFSRHTAWHKHQPGKGADFPRYAGQMIEMWTDAYSRKENQQWSGRATMLQAITVIFRRMQENHQTKSGHLLAGTDKNHQNISWPSSNLELARCLWMVAPKLPRKLGDEMRAMALKLDEQFLDLPHTITDASGAFIATVDSRTGQPRTRSMNKPYTTSWTAGYGYGSHAEMALRCYSRQQHLHNSHSILANRYRTLILAAADHYLKNNPDEEKTLTPGVFADVGNLLLAAYELNGHQAYQRRAFDVGDLAMRLFLDQQSALPKATNQHDHYEAITDGPKLMYFLARIGDKQSALQR